MFILTAVLGLCMLTHSEQIQVSHSGLATPTDTSNHNCDSESQSHILDETTTTDPSIIAQVSDDVTEKATAETTVPNSNEPVDYSDPGFGTNSWESTKLDSVFSGEPVIKGKPASKFDFADFVHESELSSSSINSKPVSETSVASSFPKTGLASDHTNESNSQSSVDQDSYVSDSLNNTRTQLNQSKDFGQPDTAGQSFNGDELQITEENPASDFKFNDSRANSTYNPNGQSWSRPSQWGNRRRNHSYYFDRTRFRDGGFGSIGGRPVYSFRHDDRYPALGQPPAKFWGQGYMSEGMADRIGTTGTTEAAVGQENNTVSVDDREPEASAGKARLPWQVSVFRKQETPWRVCGGSLVSIAAVVSAAHCFWGRAGLLPASQFAVGAGEVLPYRMDDYSSYRQQNDVADIKVPADFGGSAGGRSDIAVVLLVRPLFNQQGLRPVCVSFDAGLEERLLVPGTLATTLGIGLRKEDRKSVLERLEVPYIAEEACSRAVDREMLENFTGDKICAGFKAGSSPALGKICAIDAGAGLAFFLGSPLDVARGVGVPHLHGVATTRGGSFPLCNAGGVSLYTRVRDHRALLEEHVGVAGGVAAECARYYPQASALVETGGFVCNCYC